MLFNCRHLPILLLLFCAIIFTACDETFEPLAENDRYFFSMYGYLDASADTQWVRILPLRKGLEMLPDINGTEVTLHHVETGASSLMKDSLFTFAGRSVWNYWSDMNLNPDQKYRIIAKNPDGNISSSEIQLPEDFTTPIITTILPTNLNSIQPFSLRIEGINNLADIRTIWVVEENHSLKTHSFNFPHRNKATLIENEIYSVNIDPMNDMERIARYFHPDFNEALALFKVIKRQVFVASAGPDWLKFSDLDDMLISLPDGISNIMNGTGYMVGVVSKTIPFKNCFYENGDFAVCETEQPAW